MSVHDTGCPICGAMAPPAVGGAITCNSGHTFSLNDETPSSPEVTDEHWDELWRRWTMDDLTREETRLLEELRQGEMRMRSVTDKEEPPVVPYFERPLLFPTDKEET